MSNDDLIMTDEKIIRFLLLPKEERDRILDETMKTVKLVIDFICDLADKMVEDKKNGE